MVIFIGVINKSAEERPVYKGLWECDEAGPIIRLDRRIHDDGVDRTVLWLAAGLYPTWFRGAFSCCKIGGIFDTNPRKSRLHQNTHHPGIRGRLQLLTFGSNYTLSVLPLLSSQHCSALFFSILCSLGKSFYLPIPLLWHSSSSSSSPSASSSTSGWAPLFLRLILNSLGCFPLVPFMNSPWGQWDYIKDLFVMHWHSWCGAKQWWFMVIHWVV